MLLSSEEWWRLFTLEIKQQHGLPENIFPEGSQIDIFKIKDRTLIDMARQNYYAEMGRS